MTSLNAISAADSHSTREHARGLIVIVWLFVGLILLFLLLAGYGMTLLSAGRAYVGGEGLWSKAQKQAVQALTRYTSQPDPAHFDRFRTELAVMLGDRRARLELEKPMPDLAVARQGFLEGGNHPEDIDHMIHLFRVFRRVPDIDRAIAIWEEADLHIDQLIALGERIRTSAQAGGMKPEMVRAYLDELDHLDNRLTPLERAFSSTLDGAARKTRFAFLALMISLASVLLPAAYLFSRRLLRQNMQFQRALVESENQLRAILQGVPQPILIVRRDDHVVVYANDRALAQFHLDAGSINNFPADRFYVRPLERTQLLADLLREGQVRDQEVELQDGAGARFWALVSSRHIEFSGSDCILTTLTDIDERKRAQEELQHRAFHDELTGLPNRAMFIDAVNRAWHRAERAKGSFLLLFVDLDDFKKINDTLGHRAGDFVLCEVARRLRQCLREGDLVARLGGDEFVILVEGNDQEEDGAAIALKVLAALAVDCEIEGSRLRITASIGSSRYPEDGMEVGELVRMADAAMYQAKAAGRNTFRLGGYLARPSQAPKSSGSPT